MNQSISNNPDSKLGHLLHRLYALQQQHLCISPESMQQVANEFCLPISQITAVVEFYTFFSRRPCGRYHLLLSNCTSCGYLVGGKNLLLQFTQALDVSPGETRSDGLVSLGETSCIGMCDHGSAMLVNGIPLILHNADRVNHIAQLINAETSLADWPAEWFQVHESVNKKGLLLNQNFISSLSLKNTLAQGANEMLETILASGLRGRGGAGFSTGQKWQFCRQAEGATHYVVCNADEGEPGTFKDRLLLRQHAESMLEGMTLCAFIIGAERGFIYLRGEYRFLLSHLQTVIAAYRQAGLLGGQILGKEGFDFDIEIVVGAGAYICGEESALIESLEGKPGIPRIRPPFPVTHGYLNQPTVVNNVETFVAAAHIAVHGSAWFKTMGTTQSAGSKILSVSGDCELPGVYEYPFGVRVQQVLQDCQAGDAQAVQIGGPAGVLIGKQDFDRQIAFEDLSTGGSFMVFGVHQDLLTINRNFASFFAHESCGFCTPCRVGTKLLKNNLDKIAEGRGTRQDIVEIKRLSELIQRYSHCGLGHTAAHHVIDGLQRFPQVFEENLTQQSFMSPFDLDKTLEEARQITQRDDAAAHLK